MDSANTATSETNLLKTLSNQMADAVERVEPALVLVNGRPRQPASGIVYSDPDWPAVVRWLAGDVTQPPEVVTPAGSPPAKKPPAKKPPPKKKKR